MGSFTINTELMSIPVSLYAGAQESWVGRTGLVRGTTNKVTTARVNPVTGEMLADDQVAFSVKAANQVWVELTDEDQEANALEGNEGEIIYVVPMRLLQSGDLSIEKPYQIRPKQLQKGSRKLTDQAATMAFSRLLAALAKMRSAAIVRFAMRGKVRYGALLPDGTFLSLRFDGELRSKLPVTKLEHTDAEVDEVIGHLRKKVTEFPTLPDTYAEKMYALVEARAAQAGPNDAVVLQSGAVVVPVPPSAEVVADVMKGFVASLNAGKS
jgi:non-homologous end joining protein Ku